jgi:hypothetical protein
MVPRNKCGDDSAVAFQTKNHPGAKLAAGCGLAASREQAPHVQKALRRLNSVLG